jgi:hypothetical protein
MLREIMALVAFIVGLAILAVFWIGIIRISTRTKLRAAKEFLKCDGPIIAFFHPQAGALGGGEKVLF